MVFQPPRFSGVNSLLNFRGVGLEFNARSYGFFKITPNADKFSLHRRHPELGSWRRFSFQKNPRRFMKVFKPSCSFEKITFWIPGLTSRERSHIPPWQKDCKNWTQKCFGHVGMLPELVAVTTLTVTSLRRDPEINLHLPQLHPGWGFPS